MNALLKKTAGTVCLIVLMMLPQKCAASELVQQGIYQISCLAADGFVLDEKHCTQQEKTYDEPQLFRPLQVKQQEYYLEYVSGYYYRIASLESGRYLSQGKMLTDELSDGLDESWYGTGKNAAAVVFTVRETDGSGTDEAIDRKDSTLWRLVKRGDNTYRLRSSGGLYLTLDSNRAYNGAGLILTGKTGDKQQLWQFEQKPVFAQNRADTDVVNPYLEDGPMYGLKIAMRFHGKKETLSWETMAGWLVSPDEHTYEVDRDKVRSYISYLSETYNTAGQPRRFNTSYKQAITLYKGNYGWKLDEEKMLGELMNAIARPGTGIRTVRTVWSQEARDYDGKNSDIGTSYVEIDLTAQKVWLYKNGKQLLATDCVSGTANTERETPGGVYFVYYKQSPATLRGADYTSDVTYWMPFNGNIGMHDAPWRGSFGGDIYKTNGSHGCINLPYDAAKLIYATVSYGYPVVCYYG